LFFFNHFLIQRLLVYVESLKSLVNKIDLVNDDLKTFCERPHSSEGEEEGENSIHSNFTNFVEYLIPQFNYKIDTTGLLKSINDLNIEIGSTNLRKANNEGNSSPHCDLFIDKNKDIIKVYYKSFQYFINFHFI
jgi:hypothetical protein